MTEKDAQVSNWYVCPVCKSPSGYWEDRPKQGPRLIPEIGWWCISCSDWYEDPEIRS